MRWRKTVISALGAVLLLAPVAASAQDGAVKIGVLDDMSGPPLHEGSCPLVKK